MTAPPPALLSTGPAPAPAPGDGTRTEREAQILVPVARGLSNARIAAELDLSEATVKSRVNRILTRLGLENRVRAAPYAHRATPYAHRAGLARPGSNGSPVPVTRL